MPLLSSLISWLTFKRMNQIKLFKEYPDEVQKEMFNSLINKAKDTEWGRKYDYKSINSIQDFQERVPISKYESLENYIERIRKGENNILWPTPIKWFAKSSGTTNDKSKFIPVSKESLEECHFRGGRDAMVLYLQNKRNSRVFNGKGLVIGGSQQVNKYNNEIFYGDISAVLLSNVPFWVNFIRTPDISIALMDEWESKIEKMAHETIKDNVTNISGVPSWTLVLIKRILEITGKDNLKDVWPDLELFIHGGVSFEPYREQYKKVIPDDTMHYMETYNASEGFFGIQDDLSSNDMLLMLDYGVFYEFIPMDEFDGENSRTITLDEVELNKNYAMVISTNCGLWRYLIGDTVYFTSKQPFKFRVSGRTKQFINTFGEELIVDNAEQAFRKATEETGATIKEYTGAPVYMSAEGDAGAHQWLVEFEKEPSSLERFVEIFDNTLKELNSDYESKRYKNMTLDFPKVEVAREGLFYDWLKKKGKLGGQHKVPRLSNKRDYIEELLAMNKS